MQLYGFYAHLCLRRDHLLTETGPALATVKSGFWVNEMDAYSEALDLLAVEADKLKEAHGS